MELQLQLTYSESAAIVVIVLNVISFFSLAFVLSIYLHSWRTIASFPMRLSFYLCLACLGQSLYSIILNPITIHNEFLKNEDIIPWYCVLQGVLKVGFDLSSIIWTSLIIFSVFVSVVLRKKFESCKIEILYLFLAYILPFAVAIIPASFNKYGYANYFCWFSGTVIKDSDQQFWLQMGLFVIPLWVLLFFNIVLSAKTYLSLKRIELQKRLLIIFQRLMWFPLFMFITGFFFTIALIYNSQNQQHRQWLDITGLILLYFYGFLNSIAYGLNPLIRQKIQICFNTRSISESRQTNGKNEDESSRSSRISRYTEQHQAELCNMGQTKQPFNIQKKDSQTKK